MPIVTREVIEEEIGNDLVTLVPFDSSPRREVRTHANRGPAARAAIAEDVAQLPERSAQVRPPPIVELEVRVRVGGALRGESFGRPVLPPVEVPKAALEECFWLLPV